MRTYKVKLIIFILVLITLSACRRSEQENQQINTMFDGFLTKPVDSHRLFEAIRHFIPDSYPVNDTEDATVSDTEEIITFEYGN